MDAGNTPDPESDWGYEWNEATTRGAIPDALGEVDLFYTDSLSDAERAGEGLSNIAKSTRCLGKGMRDLMAQRFESAIWNCKGMQAIRARAGG